MTSQDPVGWQVYHAEAVAPYYEVFRARVPRLLSQTADDFPAGYRPLTILMHCGLGLLQERIESVLCPDQTAAEADLTGSRDMTWRVPKPGRRDAACRNGAS